MRKKSPEKRWVRFGKRTHREAYFGGYLPFADGILPRFGILERRQAGRLPYKLERGTAGAVAVRLKSDAEQILESKRLGGCVPYVNEGIKL